MQVFRERKALVFALLIFVAAVVAILAVLFIKQSGKSSAAEAPVVFIRDNLLMLMEKDELKPTELSGLLPENKLMAATDSWQQSLMMDQLFMLNVQRDKMFFLKEVTDDGKAVLYYRDLSKSPSDGKPGVELASAISEANRIFFEISEDGESVLYLKDYSNQRGGSLYLHDLRKEALVDEQVTAYYYADKPGLLYYMTFDEQNRQIIKMARRSSPDKKTLIDTDVWFILNIDPDSGEIYYLKTTSTGSYDFYSKLPDQSPVKLVSNMEYTVGAIQKGSFFYRTIEPKKLTLFDVVTDDLADSDALIKEPKREDYTTEERRRMTNFWTGKPFEADVEVFDQPGFDKAMRQYEEKAKRDKLRLELKAGVFDLTGVHYFGGGSSVSVADSYENLLWVDAKTGTVIYKAADIEVTPKVPLSEVSFPEEVKAKYRGNLNEAAEAYIYTPRTGTVKLNRESGASLGQAALSLDDQKLYGIEKEGALVAFDMEEGLPVHRKVLDEDVYLFQYIAEKKSKLFYYKRSDGGTSALHVYTDGASQQISGDVDYKLSKYYPHLDELYYLTAYDSSSRAGILYLYRDGKSVKIADNVHDYYYNESGGLYYIVNFSRGTGDLMRVGDEKHEQVADRVRFMFEEPDYQRF